MGVEARKASSLHGRDVQAKRRKDMICIADVMSSSNGRPKARADWFKLDITARLYRVEEIL